MILSSLARQAGEACRLCPRFRQQSLVPLCTKLDVMHASPCFFATNNWLESTPYQDHIWSCPAEWPGSKETSFLDSYYLESNQKKRIKIKITRSILINWRRERYGERDVLKRISKRAHHYWLSENFSLTTLVLCFEPHSWHGLKLFLSPFFPPSFILFSRIIIPTNCSEGWKSLPVNLLNSR